MKVSGFTFIRNAIKYDYPIVESILSILPVCDEVVVAVGKSEDETLQMIENIDSDKIRIVETEWDLTLRKGGEVLAVETDKALAAISPDTDWCFYIQGDEVVHEQYLDTIKSAMQKWKDDKKVEGLLFKYKHFYGSYDYIGDSRRWYRREIRIVRNQIGVKSYRDAQGFRINDRKLKVKEIDAYIYHYGWVKPPEKQSAKQQSFNKFWHEDEFVEKKYTDAPFDYSQIDYLTAFEGTHPKIMQPRIERKNWKFHYDPSKKSVGLKARILYLLEKYTGLRPWEYKNYIKI